MGPQMRGCQGPGGGDEPVVAAQPCEFARCPCTVCSERRTVSCVLPRIVLPEESGGCPESIQPSVPLLCRSHGWTLSRWPSCITRAFWMAAGFSSPASPSLLFETWLHVPPHWPLASSMWHGCPTKSLTATRPQLNHMLKGALDGTGECDGRGAGVPADTGGPAFWL